MPARSYDSLGRCIFCLEAFPPDQLTREHIVPRALNGAFVFQGATCDGCQKLHEYETTALKVDLAVPRILLGMKGRKRSDKKPLKLPPVATGAHLTDTDFSAFDVDLDISEYPPILVMVGLPEAGLLAGVERTGDLTSLTLSFSQIDLSSLISNSRPRQGVTTRVPQTNGPFATMLAKIAYCYGVAELGLDGFQGAEIRQLLAGMRTDTYNFVGGVSSADCRTGRRSLHELRIAARCPFQTVEVHLFASCGGVRYEVVIGKLRVDG